MTTLEKVKVITPESGLSLDSLDVQPGKLVGFDDSQDVEFKRFLIARVGRNGLKKLRGHAQSRPGNLIVYQRNRGSYELDISQFPLILRVPDRARGMDGLVRIPEINFLDSLESYRCDSAYAGNDAVIQTLRERESLGFDLYANWLESEWRISNDKMIFAKFSGHLRELGR
jgi:hypothetical protein